MSSVVAVNDIKTRRTELLRQLDALTKHRAERSVHISRDLNRKIHKLEADIHDMTMKHREEIKKCYSGAKKT